VLHPDAPAIVACICRHLAKLEAWPRLSTPSSKMPVKACPASRICRASFAEAHQVGRGFKIELAAGKSSTACAVPGAQSPGVDDCLFSDHRLSLVPAASAMMPRREYQL